MLGGGLAGLSTAYHLGGEVPVYERESEAGGVARSNRIDGYVFDYTGHLLHFKDPRVAELLDDILPGCFQARAPGQHLDRRGPHRVPLPGQHPRPPAGGGRGVPDRLRRGAPGATATAATAPSRTGSWPPSAAASPATSSSPTTRSSGAATSPRSPPTGWPGRSRGRRSRRSSRARSASSSAASATTRPSSIPPGAASASSRRRSPPACRGSAPERARSPSAPEPRAVASATARAFAYDRLVSTLPLPRLVAMSDLPAPVPDSGGELKLDRGAQLQPRSGPRRGLARPLDLLPRARPAVLPGRRADRLLLGRRAARDDVALRRGDLPAGERSRPRAALARGPPRASSGWGWCGARARSWSSTWSASPAPTSSSTRPGRKRCRRLFAALRGARRHQRRTLRRLGVREHGEGAARRHRDRHEAPRRGRHERGYAGARHPRHHHARARRGAAEHPAHRPSPRPPPLRGVPRSPARRATSTTRPARSPISPPTSCPSCVREVRPRPMTRALARLTALFRASGRTSSTPTPRRPASSAGWPRHAPGCRS